MVWGLGQLTVGFAQGEGMGELMKILITLNTYYMTQIARVMKKKKF